MCPRPETQAPASVYVTELWALSARRGDLHQDVPAQLTTITHVGAVGASLVFTDLVKRVLCSLVTVGPVFLDHGGVMLRSPRQRVAELEFDPNSLVLNLNLYTALPRGYLHI